MKPIIDVVRISKVENGFVLTTNGPEVEEEHFVYSNEWELSIKIREIFEEKQQPKETPAEQVF